MEMSIITISKDDPAGLQLTLKSVQGLPRVQHILVVRDETGASQALLEPGQGILVQDEGQGIAHAFNLGLHHATGDAVIFLNGGDRLVDPTWVERSLDLLAQHPSVDILTADAVFESPLIGPYRYKTAPLNKVHPLRIGMGMPCSHQAIVVRRTCFDRIGPFDETYTVAMDYEWLCRWVKQTSQPGRILSVAGPPVVRVDGTGLSIQREPDCLRECWRALQRHRLLLGWPLMDYGNRLGRFLGRYALTHLGLDWVVAWVKSALHNLA
jgi:glycosyltransferase involved in cell wall biosynthesis